ncbi:voltage-dependent anion-selective channel protein 2-like [Limulus polyphemus]|uniref:Voltage-dependent anion-selective channel protein 2-like n=1 Tax=Limulus polyphemus TaxID=6850 RepID=A0ABM1BD34_LIMPO|nr:voltage-dependent anion-selective channel protein 2-like [Limulus polyphemus]XP_022247354.1 voltage-dependent anion-selective channel protein 2-like [Limulus polyphemus]XP_022247355.1 voltage-dependent anion-selective channel protein 2-like [Limulus polyphemus]XP_022247356.1 voltage-dependent anion-selective channel protein 2-like [Limulus polyphemus]XP_022247357.1 voltage-dependent anion-selective channel protein 2-like [Limulus polyphemus]XP_022247358.1 voltage-dependent anion-selective c
MVPPCYADLGKTARDVFNKNYNFGLLKLECKTKTENGVEFTASGTSNSDTGRVQGSLETKYKISDYGFTLKEKWNTDNTLATELSIEDQLVKGLKLGFDGVFVPHSGKKTGTLKTAYKLKNFHLNTDIDLDLLGIVFHCAGVLHCHGWLAGYQMSFDTTKSMLTRNNFSVGYSASDFTLHTNVNDGQEFGGSVYQKISDKLDTAIQLAWTAGNNVSRFGIGFTYKIDGNTTFRGKVNNSSQLGLGCTHKMRDGVQLTLSCLIDGKNLSSGGHKLGLGLDLEA